MTQAQTQSNVEDIIESEEARAESDAAKILAMTQQSSEWERLVAEMKKRTKGPLFESSTMDFLQWKLGIYMLRIDGSGIFEWDDPSQDPSTRSCPVLHVTVLDGNTREVKALAGKKFRVSVHYQMARVLLDACGMKDEKRAVIGVTEVIKLDSSLISSRVEYMTCYIACDESGIPVKKTSKRGRLILADAHTICGM